MPEDTGRTHRTRSYFCALLVLFLVGFIALGVWQVQRRTWKLALIGRVEQRVHAAPIDAPARARWPAVDAADDEYRHVRANGLLLEDRATRVVAVTEYGRGYWLMVPLRRPDGDIVLVNRGFVVGTDARPPVGASVVVTGLLRVTEPHGSFLHDNDPAHDRWYSRDVEAIARARGLQSVAPYFIDADAGADAEVDAAAHAAAPVAREPGVGQEPIGGLTVVAFRNDHLMYAVTWFTLASLCAGALFKLVTSSYGPDK